MPPLVRSGLFTIPKLYSGLMSTLIMIGAPGKKYSMPTIASTPGKNTCPAISLSISGLFVPTG